MKAEMPKWIEIQKSYIEATVEIEVAKANRTPSAFREIFEGFASAIGEQIKTDLQAYNTPEGLTALSSFSPLIAMFALLQGNTTPIIPPGEEPPTSTDTFLVPAYEYDNWTAVPAGTGLKQLRTEVRMTASQEYDCQILLQQISIRQTTVNENQQFSHYVENDIGPSGEIEGAAAYHRAKSIVQPLIQVSLLHGCQT